MAAGADGRGEAGLAWTNARTAGVIDLEVVAFEAFSALIFGCADGALTSTLETGVAIG